MSVPKYFLPYDKDEIQSIDQDYAVKNWSIDFSVSYGKVETCDIRVYLPSEPGSDIERKDIQIHKNSPLAEYLLSTLPLVIKPYDPIKEDDK